MPVQTCCPSCGTSYTLEDQLLGKKARCKQCRQYFVINGHVLAAEGEDEVELIEDDRVQATAPAQPPAAVRGTVPGPFPRKKKRRKAPTDDALRRRILLGGSVAVLLLAATVGGVLFLFGGHRPPDPLGRWKGAPEVRREVEDAVKNTKVNNTLAEKFIGAISQKAADELLAVTIHFKDTGQAFYSGNTACIGIPGEGDGPWEVLSTAGDVLIVRMGPAKAPFEARLAFRDRDAFSLTRLDQQDASPILFTRVKD
jgi:hypothetical protein